MKITFIKIITIAIIISIAQSSANAQSLMDIIQKKNVPVSNSVPVKTVQKNRAAAANTTPAKKTSTTPPKKTSTLPSKTNSTTNRASNSNRRNTNTTRPHQETYEPSNGNSSMDEYLSNYDYAARFLSGVWYDEEGTETLFNADGSFIAMSPNAGFTISGDWELKSPGHIDLFMYYDEEELKLCNQFSVINENTLKVYCNTSQSSYYLRRR